MYKRQSLYYKGDGADLQLIDPKFDSIQPDEKVSLAMKTCEEMMGKDDRIISANSSYSDEKDFKYMVASNGFEGEACGSSFSLVASVKMCIRDRPFPFLRSILVP